MNLFKKWWFWVILVLVYVIVGMMITIGLLSEAIVQIAEASGAESLMDSNIRGNLFMAVLLWPLVIL
jgi:hypothetical protein